jgi:hypothetical protein
VGEASHQKRLSPSEYLDRLELSASCRHGGLVPSCSQRDLQSLSGAHGIVVLVGDPSLAFYPQVGMTFEVFPRVQAGRVVKIQPGSSHGLRSTPGCDPNRTASCEASSLGFAAPTAL